MYRQIEINIVKISVLETHFFNECRIVDGMTKILCVVYVKIDHYMYVY